MRKVVPLLCLTLVGAILVGCGNQAVDPNDPSLKKNAGKPSMMGGGGAGGPAKGGPGAGTQN